MRRSKIKIKNITWKKKKRFFQKLFLITFWGKSANIRRLINMSEKFHSVFEFEELPFLIFFVIFILFIYLMQVGNFHSIKNKIIYWKYYVRTKGNSGSENFWTTFGFVNFEEKFLSIFLAVTNWVISGFCSFGEPYIFKLNFFL